VGHNRQPLFREHAAQSKAQRLETLPVRPADQRQQNPLPKLRHRGREGGAMKKPMTPAAADPLAAIVDELGDLEKELQPFKPKIARAEALRKMLRDKYREQAADQSFQVHGTKWSALLSACGNSTEILVRALFKAIGASKFLDVATVSIKAASAAVPAEVLASCSSVSQTGSRSLTVVPRAS
jgi:hypothetical protein